MNHAKYLVYMTAYKTRVYSKINIHTNGTRQNKSLAARELLLCAAKRFFSMRQMGISTLCERKKRRLLAA